MTDCTVNTFVPPELRGATIFRFVARTEGRYEFRLHNRHTGAELPFRSRVPVDWFWGHGRI